MEKLFPDPMGAAIADYWAHGIAAKLRVFSPDFEEDEIPVELLFRNFEDMPSLEKAALQRAEGRILDVGAGAGCHSIALQQMGKSVSAIDISPLSVSTMQKRGVVDARLQDFWTLKGEFDTILMLMNGIGIVGTVDAMPRFFRQIDSILAEGGQVILDSSDICYLYEVEEDIIELPDDGHYYGELEYQMQYKRIKGEPFKWLYIDFETLAQAAEENGFKAEPLLAGEHYDYLARLIRM